MYDVHFHLRNIAFNSTLESCCLIVNIREHLLIIEHTPVSRNFNFIMFNNFREAFVMQSSLVCYQILVLGVLVWSPWILLFHLLLLFFNTIFMWWQMIDVTWNVSIAEISRYKMILTMSFFLKKKNRKSWQRHTTNYAPSSTRQQSIPLCKLNSQSLL